MAHTLPPLPYAYNALEPYISEQIMTLHHTKHHQTYVNALNAAEASYAKASTAKERIALQAALKFNGGGELEFYVLRDEGWRRARRGEVGEGMVADASCGTRNSNPAPALRGRRSLILFPKPFRFN